MFDSFFQEVHCPKCGTPGAVQALFWIKCPNRGCEHYNPARAAEIKKKMGRKDPPVRSDQGVLWGPSTVQPTGDEIEIRYTNFRGQVRSFVAHKTSLRNRGAFITLRVAPKNIRIALKKDRLANLADLQALLVSHPEPTGSDRQVLSYHFKHGTSSPRFEELRRRFPHWDRGSRR